MSNQALVPRLGPNDVVQQSSSGGSDHLHEVQTRITRHVQPVSQEEQKTINVTLNHYGVVPGSSNVVDDYSRRSRRHKHRSDRKKKSKSGSPARGNKSSTRFKPAEKEEPTGPKDVAKSRRVASPIKQKLSQGKGKTRATGSDSTSGACHDASDDSDEETREPVKRPSPRKAAPSPAKQKLAGSKGKARMMQPGSGSGSGTDDSDESDEETREPVKQPSIRKAAPGPVKQTPAQDKGKARAVEPDSASDVTTADSNDTDSEGSPSGNGSNADSDSNHSGSSTMSYSVRKDLRTLKTTKIPKPSNFDLDVNNKIAGLEIPLCPQHYGWSRVPAGYRCEANYGEGTHLILLKDMQRFMDGKVDTPQVIRYDAYVEDGEVIPMDPSGSRTRRLIRKLPKCADGYGWEDCYEYDGYRCTGPDRDHFILTKSVERVGRGELGYVRVISYRAWKRDGVDRSYGPRVVINNDTDDSDSGY